MPPIYVVTGNPHKLASFERHLKDYSFKSMDIDLPEIQSSDTQVIITDKVTRAYEEVGKPVLVEDVAVALDALNGMPGPFIKFFEERMGPDAIYQLVAGKSSAVTVTSTIGYYDGSKLIITEGVVHGTAVAARGENGWGFDACFQPDGQTKTYGEMTFAEKDAISHRSLSIAAFLNELKQL
jgi:non-canonical purine NTP pyrophosphatase (RdgB/HAM1 family)